MGRPLEIRTDLASPAALRALARRESNRRTATRLLAIAHAPEGTSRAEAARLVGLERQALRDVVILRGSPDRRDWTLPMLCRWLEARFAKRRHPPSLSRIVRRLDLSRQKTRPLHPLADARAQAAFAKGGSRVPSWSRLRRIRTSA